jgi:hypothetical protein
MEPNNRERESDGGQGLFAGGPYGSFRFRKRPLPDVPGAVALADAASVRGANREVRRPWPSVDRISARSGVSKATIYKWWPNRTAVAIDEFLHQMMAAAPVPDTGSAAEDFR